MVRAGEPNSTEKIEGRGHRHQSTERCEIQNGFSATLPSSLIESFSCDGTADNVESQTVGNQFVPGFGDNEACESVDILRDDLNVARNDVNVARDGFYHSGPQASEHPWCSP